MDGYVVDCKIESVDGKNVIRVYGIHAESDPRTGSVDNKYLMISISGLTNPGTSIKSSNNKVDIYHKRWTYSAGPTFTVHESEDITFEQNMDPESIDVTCSATNGYTELDGNNKAPAGL